MIYILVLMVMDGWSGKSASTIAVEFKSREACNAALSVILAKNPDEKLLTFRKEGYCVGKGN